MDNKERGNVPPLGDFGTPSGRHSGSTVPAPAVSSSYDGLPTGLAASPGGEWAIASEEGGNQGLLAGTGPIVKSMVPLEPKVVLVRADAVPGEGRDGPFRIPRRRRGLGGSMGSLRAASPAPSGSSSSRDVSGGEDVDVGVVSEDDAMSTSSCPVETPHQRARKRGRPPTSGEYIDIAAAKKVYSDQKERELRLREQEVELARQERLLAGTQFDRDESPNPRSLRDLPSVDELWKALEGLPPNEVKERTEQAVKEIIHISNTTSNMKGTYVRTLRLAARGLHAAVLELGRRARYGSAEKKISDLETAKGNVMKQLREARADLREVREENLRLKKEAEALKASKTPLPGTPSPPPENPAQNSRPQRTKAKGVSSYREDSDGAGTEKRGGSAESDVTIVGRDSIGSAEDLFHRDLTGKERDEIWERRFAALESRLEAGLRGAVSPILEIVQKKKRKSPPVVRPALEFRSLAVDHHIRQSKRRMGLRGSALKKAPADYNAPSGGGEGERGKAAAPPTLPNMPPTGEHQGPEATSAAAAPEPWSKVLGRKERRLSKPSKAQPKPPPPPGPPPQSGGSGRGTGGNLEDSAKKKKKKKKKKRTTGGPRAPTTAAVMLAVGEEAGCTPQEALLEARKKIELADLGIADSRVRFALNGAIVVEIPGKDKEEKADVLAGKIAEVARAGVRVSRPTRCLEMRLRGVEMTVTPEEVISALAKAGGCPPGEIRLGEIRRSPRGLGTVWARCPAAAAIKAASAGRLRVGWSSATSVELLRARPLQCYRCLEFGHLRQACTATVDRSGLCYRCGGPDHKAARCSAGPRCPLCAEAGRPAEHRVGGKGCAPPPSRRGRRATKVKPGGPASRAPPDKSRTPASREPPSRERGKGEKVADEGMDMT